MERSVKEAKKEKQLQITTVEQTLECMKSDVEASKVLRELQQQGLDENKIAKYILSYCGGATEKALAGLGRGQWFVDTLKDCAEKLSEAADFVERTLQVCDQLHQPLLDPELLNILRNNAETLAKAAEKRQGLVKNIRIGGEGKRESITSGRTHVLLRFAYALQAGKNLLQPKEPRKTVKTKPSKPVYDQIARLIRPVLAKPDQNYVLMAEALRKAVEREADAQFAERRDMTRDEFDQMMIEIGQDDYEDLIVSP